MKLIRNEIIFGSTHRLEILNAIGFSMWGMILSIGSHFHKDTCMIDMYANLENFMPIRLWGTLFICVAFIQMLGLFCGMRRVRICTCGISATIMCMLVYIFGKIDIRVPFFTFGCTWAIALWIAMIHDTAAEDLTALLKWKRKPKAEETTPAETRIQNEQYQR